MANSKAVNIEKQVECPICLEQYKEPKVLSCLHSYCKSCLQKYVIKSGDSQHKIACPECRQETQVPDGDVGKLQANFWVNNLIDLLTITSSDKAQKLICENCDSGDTAVSRCSDCCVFICDMCVKAHGRMRNLKHHQIVSLEEVKSGSPKALIQPVCCEKHGEEILKLFCQTCEKPICRDCTMVEHRSHDYLFIADAASKEKESVKKLLKKTKLKVLVLADGVKSVEKMEEKVQARVTAVTQDIDELKEKQIRALEEVLANLKHDARTIGRAKVKQLQAQREGLMITLASATNSVEFTERVLRDGGDVELLSMKKQLATNLSKLNSSTCECEPCQEDTIKLQVHQDVWQVAGNLATVDDLRVVPKKCTISMVGGESGVIYDTLACQTREFTVVLRDSQGNQRRGEQIQVTVFGPSSLDGTLIKVTDNNDGTHSFAFLPQEEGHYQLHVTVSKHHIQGSPYQWNVLPKVSIRNVNQYLQYYQLGIAQSQQKLIGTSTRNMGVLSWKVKVHDTNCLQDANAFGHKTAHKKGKQVRQVRQEVVAPRELGIILDQSLSTWTIRSDGLKYDIYQGTTPSNIKAWEDGDVFLLFLNMDERRLKIHQLRTSESEVFENFQEGVALHVSPVNSDIFSFDV